VEGNAHSATAFRDSQTKAPTQSWGKPSEVRWTVQRFAARAFVVPKKPVGKTVKNPTGLNRQHIDSVVPIWIVNRPGMEWS
jgi:hypothetical protein